MLNHWYQLPRQVKTIVVISTCVVIYLCQGIQALAPIYVGMGVVIGLGIYGLQEFHRKRAENHTSRRGFAFLIHLLSITMPFLYLAFLPRTHFLIMIIQGLGFILLGFFLISIYQHRAKRHDD
ncbi:MAG: hypothetical protein QM666_04685 [Acinetobacter sp.]